MKVEQNSEKIRVDQALVSRGLVNSRTLAARLIEAGQVYSGSEKISKASQQVQADTPLWIEDGLANRYVSRAGLKLESALRFFEVDAADSRVLDVGISTGGFTDCVLQHGAATVVGIDVGHDQLAAKLKDDPRVTLYEGINARDLSKYTWLDPFDLIVIDVSFISLTKVLPEVVKFLTRNGKVLALLKPQFEVGRDILGKNGVVPSEFDFHPLRQKMKSHFESLGLEVRGESESPILGGDGNKEFFIYAVKR